MRADDVMEYSELEIRSLIVTSAQTKAFGLACAGDSPNPGQAGEGEALKVAERRAARMPVTTDGGYVLAVADVC